MTSNDLSIMAKTGTIFEFSTFSESLKAFFTNCICLGISTLSLEIELFSTTNYLSIDKGLLDDKISLFDQFFHSNARS